MEYIINNDKIYLLEFIELNANSMILIQCHIFSQYKIVNCWIINYEDYRLSIMSEYYIYSLNLKNAFEFYLFAVDIKNQELDYIDEILTNDSVPFILNCEQFERWINKNYRLVFYLLCLSKQNYVRIMDYSDLLKIYYIQI